MKNPVIIIASLWVVALVIFALAQGQDSPAPKLTERDHSQQLAKELGGVAEYRLPDGSRVDILTPSVAWEVEWVEKWPESIGQSLFYSLSTDREPGVILLFRGNDKDEENYLEALSVVSALRQHMSFRLKVYKTQ